MVLELISPLHYSFQWMGFVRKIFTGKPCAFYHHPILW